MKDNSPLESRTRNFFFCVITLMAGLSPITGCDIIETAIDRVLNCEPNESSACTCADGSQGVTFCGQDAGTWSVCICSDSCTPQKEVCDGIDNDCDGETDEDILWFQDNDLDGHGNPGQFVESCEQPADDTSSFVLLGDDCNDNDPLHWTTGPQGAGCDDDCVDLDSDGYGALCDLGEDCDDNASDCNANCTEYYHDKDSDGFGDPNDIQKSCTQPNNYVTDNTDCDDLPAPEGCGADCFPGNPESCDLHDNDCDPSTPDATNCEFGCIDGNVGECYPECNPDIHECCNQLGIKCSHCCEGMCLSWLDEAWSYRIELEIQGNRVQEELKDFPIYVDLAHLKAHFLHHMGQTGGADVRVTSGDGVTELPFQLFFNESLGKGALYLRADAVTPAKNTIFYIYYGNPAATAYNTADEFGAANVWTKDYVGVWHMEEAANSILDSTAGAHHGQPSGVSKDENGHLGAAIRFGQHNSSSILVPHSDAFDFQTHFAMSAWLFPTGDGTNVILTKGNQNKETGFSLAIVNDKLVFQSKGAALLSSSIPVAQNAWTHVALTADENALTFYLNGKNAGSTTDETLQLLETAPLLISSDIMGQQFQGMIDEVRVAGQTRSLGWILTTYRNQRNPEQFYKARMDTCESSDHQGCDTDADGDGAISAACAGGTDCDDNPATGAICTDNCQSYYIDADGDGIGNGRLEQVAACSLSDGIWPGLSNLGTDCDDADDSCFENCGQFYPDKDGDRYGIPGLTIEACTAPAGYADNSTDCDDSDPAHWSPPSVPGAVCDDDCIDQDGDGYGLSCDRSHGSYGDCDDNDAKVHVRRKWYRDQDGDGFGNQNETTEEICSIVPPEGYVANGEDSDDDPQFCGAACYPHAPDICDEYDNDADNAIDEDPDRIWFQDCDMDGYINKYGSSFKQCDSPALGADECDEAACNCPNQLTDKQSYPDCDDTDPACNADCNSDIDFDGQRDCSDPCVDLDRDSFGTGNECKNLDEYNQWSFDCNELDSACHTGCAIFYPDKDKDGKGDSNLANRLVSCSFDIPAGFVTNFDDCDDTDKNHWTLAPDGSCQDATDCQDEDQDGFGLGCDRGGDCNDSDSRCHQEDDCSRFYRDLDGDGYGAARSGDKGPHFNDPDFDAGVYEIVRCDTHAPVGYVDNRQDCFDGDKRVWTLLDGGLTMEPGPDASPDFACATADCIDRDGDGFGIGCDLGDNDCDDTPETGGWCVDNCTLFYLDKDRDGYGATAKDPDYPSYRCVLPSIDDFKNPDDFIPLVKNHDDCDDNNENYWSRCDCVDHDKDGYGKGCDMGPDCDDESADCQETGCSLAYPDMDGDGFAGAEQAGLICGQLNPGDRVERNGIIYYGEITDCDDSDPHSWSGTPPHCNPGCDDKDGDGRGPGCDEGNLDCAPGDPYHWSRTETGCDDDCVDSDGDGRGENCDLEDCDDTPGIGRLHWTWNADKTGCEDSTDGNCDDPDSDGYGPGCDMGSFDCDNEDNSCHIGCGTFYPDRDGDGRRAPNGAYTGCPIPKYISDNAELDYCDNDPLHWSQGSSDEAGCDDDCVDRDRDGFGSGCDLSNDCDDNPVTGRACTQNCRIFYRDSDGDGYGNPQVTVTACSAPEGYVENFSDCDDTSPKCPKDIACKYGYSDKDGDSYGDAATQRLVCPEDAAGKSRFGDGLVENDYDCQDTGELARFRWFVCDSRCVDADRDGYGKGCDMGPDCDDSECEDGKCKEGERGKYWIAQTYYADMDGDGVGDSSTKFEDCYGRLEGQFVTKGGDCDDSITTGKTCHNTCNTFYTDNDGDGLGSTPVKTCAAQPPDNTVYNNLDCVDKDPECKTKCHTYYIDDDKDNFGDPNRYIKTCDKDPPEESDDYAWVENGDDCDDNLTGNLSMNWSCPTSSSCIPYFADKDGDGYGDPNDSINGCPTQAPKHPDRPKVAFVLDKSDCNDKDKNLHSDCSDKSCSIDKDGDGYSSGLGCEPRDCDDHPLTGRSCYAGCVDYYMDNDGDGAYLDTGPTRTICPDAPAPAGWARSAVRTEGDCDDNDASRAPGKDELCDGKDNNCENGVDENSVDCLTGTCVDGVCRDGISCSTSLPFKPGISELPATLGPNNFQVKTDYWCASSATPGNDIVWQVTIPAKNNNLFEARLLDNSQNGVLALVTDCGNPVGSCLAGTNFTKHPDYNTHLTYVNETDESIQAYLIYDSMATGQEAELPRIEMSKRDLVPGNHCAAPYAIEGDGVQDEWTTDQGTDMQNLVQARCAPSDGVEQVWSVDLAANEVLRVDLDLNDPAPTQRTMYLVEGCESPAQCLSSGDADEPLIYENRSDTAKKLYIVVDGASADDAGSYELVIHRSALCYSVDDCRAEYAYDHACIGGVCTPVALGGNTCENAWTGIGDGSYSSSTEYQEATTQPYNAPHCEERAAPGKDELWQVSIPAGHLLTANYYELQSSPGDRVLYLIDECSEVPAVNLQGPCLPGDSDPVSASITHVNLLDETFTGYLVCDSSGTQNGGGAPYGLDVSIEPVKTGDHFVSIRDEESYLIDETGQYQGDTSTMSNLLQADQFAFLRLWDKDVEPIESEGRDEVWKVQVNRGDGILYTLDASWPGANLYTIFPPTTLLETSDPVTESISHHVVSWTGYSGKEYYHKLDDPGFPDQIIFYLVVDGAGAGNYGSYTLDVKIGPEVAPEPKCKADEDCQDDNPCTTNSCQHGQCVNENATTGPTAACNDGNICTLDICEAGACKNEPLPLENRALECDGNKCTTGDMCDANGTCQPGTKPKICESDDPCVRSVCDKKEGCLEIYQIGPCVKDDKHCTLGTICQDGECVEGDQLYACEDFNQHCRKDLDGAEIGCVDCLSDSHCQKGNYCDTIKGHVCEACESDNHCGPNCENCAGNSMVCAEDHSGCVQCTEDTHCDVGEWCNNGACTSCNTDEHCTMFCADCSASDLICSGDNTKCVECNNDNDCSGDPERPICDTAGQECVGCNVDGDCELDEYCAEDSTCVSCTANDQCGMGCVPCGTGENLVRPVCTDTGSGFECGCVEGYAGENCDECASGYYRIPDGSCIPLPNGCADVIAFADANLEQIVRVAAEYPTGDLTWSDVKNVTELEAAESNIQSLEGLQCLTGLTKLDLGSNRISDINPLVNLYNLQQLYLQDNQIGDISPLTNLTGLIKLNLTNNQISDLSHLVSLNNMTYLALNGNQVGSISYLANLDNLAQLYLFNCHISDITPLANLSHLTVLYISRNQISDLTPLSGLNNLTKLYLTGNLISNLAPLSNLVSLTTLVLNENQIEVIAPLVENTGIDNGDVVELNDNPIECSTQVEPIQTLLDRGVQLAHECTMPPAGCGGAITFADSNLEQLVREEVGIETAILTWYDVKEISELNEKYASVQILEGLQCLTGLTYIQLGYGQISDLSPLANLSDLSLLILQYNEISDLSPLASLSQLTTLNLGSNQISDLSPLAGLTNLTRLSIYDNAIGDLSPLTGLTNLTLLNALRIQAADIHPLANLTNLISLHLFSNQISDLSPLVNLTNLTLLDLGSNQINDITPLTNLTKLTTLKLSKNAIANIAPLAGLSNLTLLNLDENNLSEISSLSNLTDLTTLDLRKNEINEVSPIVDNIGIDSGDTVNIKENPIECRSQAENIQNLLDRGVDLSHDCNLPPAGCSGPISFPDENLELAVRDAIGMPVESFTWYDLSDLTTLTAPSANIQNLEGIHCLTSLTEIDLASNQITDISPLIENTGIDSGDLVTIVDNPLECSAQAESIQSLLDRGVNLIHDCAGPPEGCAGVIAFADENLESEVRAAIGIPVGDLRYYDVSGLSSLSASSANITDLNGIQCLTGLVELDLQTNGIVDIGPLSNLSLLSSLNLTKNQISDISGLANLTNLDMLALGNNRISNISPLSNLSNLSHLVLERNQISDISGLANLTNLRLLYFYDNQINDISSLAHLTNLENLYLQDNNISDISPMSNLTNLATLNLYGNNINNLNPLSNLTNLTTLTLSKNIIDNIAPLANLTNLKTLNIWGNSISDLSPLSNLNNLATLDLYWNNINDISPLANLTNLATINLSKNNIDNIEALTNLTKLKTLYIYGNDIVDISPLANKTNLSVLQMQDNNIVDISPLASCTNLTMLILYNNSIRELGAVVNMRKLYTIRVDNNQISNIHPLVSNTGIGNTDNVNISGNPIDCDEQASNLQALRDRGVKLTTSCP